MPSTSIFSLSDKIQQIADVKCAVLFSSGTPCISSNNLVYFSSSVAFSPQYLAEYTPGLPSSASTDNPESSAMAGIPVALKAAFAFIKAFSAKVVPVSSTSPRFTPASFAETASMPRGFKILSSSFNFFALLVAMINFIPHLLILRKESPCKVLCIKRL